MVDQKEAALRRHIAVHLVIVLQVRAFISRLTHGRVHHHQNDFAGGIFFQDPRDDVFQVVAGLRHGGVAPRVGVVHGKLDEHRVRVVPQDFFIQAFPSPRGIGSALGAVDHRGLPGILLFEHRLQLVDPRAHLGQAGAERHHDLFVAGRKVAHQLTPFNYRRFFIFF